MKKFLVNTAIGGVLFLVPLVIVAVTLGKAFDVMMLVVEPVQRFIPIERFAGVAVVNLMAALLMFVGCVAAGFFARSKPAQRFYQRIDSILLEFIPGYAWSKAVFTSMGDGEADNGLTPVLVRLDDQVQIALEVERAAGGQVVVFFPGAPDARSGTVAYVEATRIEALDARFLDINKCLKHLGKGAGRFIDASAGVQ